MHSLNLHAHCSPAACRSSLHIIPRKSPGCRAASIPCWGGKNLFDQILPSRAVNQSPRNASFHKSCSCSTSQVPKHHPTSQSREKNLPNEDPPAQSWLQGLTPKQGKSQLPLGTSVLLTHLEGIKCILLGEERSSVCSGAALPALKSMDAFLKEGRWCPWNEEW